MAFYLNIDLSACLCYNPAFKSTVLPEDIIRFHIPYNMVKNVFQQSWF